MERVEQEAMVEVEWGVGGGAGGGERGGVEKVAVGVSGPEGGSVEEGCNNMGVVGCNSMGVAAVLNSIIFSQDGVRPFPKVCLEVRHVCSKATRTEQIDVQQSSEA